MGSNPTTSAKGVNYGLIAQWLERSPVKRGVVGSSPTLTANNGRVAERFKAAVLKTVGRESGPWVRIPPLPPKVNVPFKNLCGSLVQR